ncbi:MAG: acyl-CoA thioesterase [Bacteroidaceae bacterium]|uniref:acyl-CoA thioesterase n=1 Tax=unclassified Bacteroides TaxID=2646097 RepID=UPI0004E11CE5|nr:MULTISPECIES: acyl-CoA thioesterase [unclassified Bacteroides]MBP5219293.1 acyl-CoA thioesterase [Bacteroidaceae bacterium]MBQ2056336.1 acyl-CoA thioesterase [Bacteroidaceae bacterium]
MMELVAEKKIEIRFSEVDVMNVVWHGSYPLYFEDAREAFGAKYGLSYKRYMDEKVFAPIVELDIKYKRPILYGMTPVVRIVYRPTEAAKIVFDYEIVDAETGTVFATAHSVQVFMDMNYNLMWDNPGFFVEWKKQWGIQHG